MWNWSQKRFAIFKVDTLRLSEAKDKSAISILLFVSKFSFINLTICAIKQS
jgi:hypothetical protein